MRELPFSIKAQSTPEEAESGNVGCQLTPEMIHEAKKERIDEKGIEDSIEKLQS